MGGPLWARREDAAWTVVKGEYDEREDALAAARREFEEETGVPPGAGELLELGEVRQAGGKRVTAWAVETDLDPAELHSNTFELEWPPRSGRTQEFPEIDRYEWCGTEDARRRLVKAQGAFLDRLVELLGTRS